MQVSRRGLWRSGARELARAVAAGLHAARGGRGRARDQATPAGKERDVGLRPPGALPEAEFLAACTRCDACIEVCPKGAIRKVGTEFGARLAGTPVVLPELNPCWLCAELPCIAACEPRALRPVPGPEHVRMGLAEIDETRCFAARGSICETCQERCPVRPKAITVAIGKPPVLRVERCTGCGVCAWLCPADAVKVNASPSAHRHRDQPAPVPACDRTARG